MYQDTIMINLALMSIKKKKRRSTKLKNLTCVATRHYALTLADGSCSRTSTEFGPKCDTAALEISSFNLGDEVCALFCFLFFLNHLNKGCEKTLCALVFFLQHSTFIFSFAF